MSIAHVPHSRPKPKGRNRPLEELEKPPAKAKSGKVKTFRLNLGKTWLYPLIGIGIIALLGGVYAFQDSMPLKSIECSILAGEDNGFLSREDLLNISAEGGEGSLKGLPMKEVRLEEIEARLLEHPTVKKAEVYKSFMGTLKMEVELREAVGRMINNSGSHLYVDSEGKKFPISRHHTAYVPLLRGDFEEGMVDTFSCETISDAIPVLDFLAKDEFWKAQIAELVIAQDGQLTLHPSIGEMEIQFGYPIRIEEKFANLMDFYKQVIPVKGWEAYRSVNLKFKGQVVGKKR